MTANELARHFNNEYGINKPWPATYPVSAETYGNCCQFVFSHIMELNNLQYSWGMNHVISLGKVGKGLMFKGVELILDPTL